MTEPTTDIDGNESDQDAYADANAPKVLRKQNAKLAADLAAAQKVISDLQAATRKTAVAEALKAKGAEPKLAKYITDPEINDEDTVLAWLRENGSDFGWEDPDTVDDETVTQQQRVAAATAIAGTAPARGTAAQTLHDLKTKTGAELKALGLI